VHQYPLGSSGSGGGSGGHAARFSAGHGTWETTAAR